MNKKGFTLIELLAVIIILGILMIIAIPSVTKYISDSRKNAYIDTAKEIIGGARNLVNEGKLEMYDTDTTYYIESSCIKTENASKSPYGDFTEAYVVVTYDGKGYTYYWTSNDDAGQGIKEIIRVDKLDIDNIESDLKDSEISTLRGIDGRSQTLVISKANGCQKEGSNDAKTDVDGETGEESKIGAGSCVGSCICKRATTLHTKTCNAASPYGCKGNPATSTTITYGNLWDGKSDLVPGDALDCDVNANGVFNERFYYVTSHGSRNNKTAVLIYYGNVGNTGSSVTVPIQTHYAYDYTSGKNIYGPTTGKTYLPKTSQWSSPLIVLPEENRQIVNENGGITTALGTIEPFTYGTAARLLTVQEFLEGCPSLTSIGRTATGEIDDCIFFMENIGYYEANSGSYGYWLETPHSSNSYNVWLIDAYYRIVNKTGAVNTRYIGIRPVIEVLESSISGE